jgi:hypothetical protein
MSAHSVHHTAIKTGKNEEDIPCFVKSRPQTGESGDTINCPESRKGADGCQDFAARAKPAAIWCSRDRISKQT